MTLVAAVVAVAMGTALGVLRAANGGAVTGVEGVLPQVAFAAAMASPGLFGLLGVRRPVAAVAGGVAGLPLSFVAMSMVTVPLLVPSMLLIMSPHTRDVPEPPPWRVLAAVVGGVATCIGAFACLYLRADPASYSLRGGGGSTSDTITPGEAGLSLVVLAIGLAAVWSLAKPAHPLTLRGTNSSIY